MVLKYLDPKLVRQLGFQNVVMEIKRFRGGSWGT